MHQDKYVFSQLVSFLGEVNLIASLLSMMETNM